MRWRSIRHQASLIAIRHITFRFQSINQRQLAYKFSKPAYVHFTLLFQLDAREGHCDRKAIQSFREFLPLAAFLMTWNYNLSEKFHLIPSAMIFKRLLTVNSAYESVASAKKNDDTSNKEIESN